ncbi:SprT-like protein [Alteribacillus persepolensis]|uniref:Protein SprT-like n=1 Tax=Alteribacillus persepolensis TaxID=568899 RepID=A0A1G8FEZ1_9BACI|nr:SprT family protein [Alteribacillus persepolensis]SDH80728.1 SprT-like protein [Alteribacillus persepolensis]
MDDETLTELTKEISTQYFAKPFLHKAVFNRRLRTTGGRYLLHSHHIEINPKHYERFGREELVAILKHELCHYHLHLEGKGYQHKDRNFKDLLEQVGGARHCKTIPELQNRRKTIHLYQCLECEQTFRRHRRMDTAKYVCGICRGKIKKI